MHGRRVFAFLLTLQGWDLSFPIKLASFKVSGGAER